MALPRSHLCRPPVTCWLQGGASRSTLPLCPAPPPPLRTHTAPPLPPPPSPRDFQVHSTSPLPSVPSPVPTHTETPLAPSPRSFQVQHLPPQPRGSPVGGLEAAVRDGHGAVLEPGLVHQVVQHRHLRRGGGRGARGRKGREGGEGVSCIRTLCKDMCIRMPTGLWEGEVPAYSVHHPAYTVPEP